MVDMVEKRSLEEKDVHSLDINARVPVLLVHGALCDVRIWDDLTLELKDIRERIVAAHLPGFWPDEFKPDQFSGEKHVRALVDILRQLDEPADIVGHSRGGRLALAAAGLCPERVHSLVLAEPGGVTTPDFHLSSPPLPGAHLQEVASLVRDGKYSDAMQVYVDAGHGPGTWQSLPTKLQMSMSENAPTIFGMMGDRSAPLDRASARRIVAPVLLLEGEQSPPEFGRVLDVLAEELPRRTRRSLGNADHFFPATQPKALAVELLRWWASLD